MPKVGVNAFSISLDGFGAGPDQSLDAPLGQGGEALRQWFFPTRTFQKMYGSGERTTGVDEAYAARSMAGLGAWVMGCNLLDPVRGPWPDDSWRGWWGETPPYHCPVFVLTHHGRPPLEMDGGTVFHFVTEGPDVALERAMAAAGDQDVRIGGGAATIPEYLTRRAIDEMHLAVSPVLLGRGEPLLAGLDFAALGYAVTEHAAGEAGMHVVVSKRG